MTFLR
jgi:hypothetical protein